MGELKKGDIVRYQLQNNNAVLIERVFSINAASKYEFNNSLFYSTGDSFPTYPSADFMLLFGQTPYAHDEFISFDNNGNEITYDTTEMNQVFIYENGKLERIPIDRISAYLRPGSKLLLFINDYRYTSTMIIN